MLSHAEIVIRAPDNDIPFAIRPVIAGMRMLAGNAFQLDKMPIPALTFQPVQLILEFLAVIQFKRPRVFKKPRSANSLDLFTLWWNRW